MWKGRPVGGVRARGGPHAVRALRAGRSSAGTQLQCVGGGGVLRFEGDDGKHHAGRTGAWDLRQESCHLAAAQPDAFSLASWC